MCSCDETPHVRLPSSDEDAATQLPACNGETIYYKEAELLHEVEITQIHGIVHRA